MKSLLLYICQVILVSGLLYGYYYFFLRNKQFHQYNRFYLLLASVAALAIPFVRIPLSITPSVQTSPGVVHLLETIYTTQNETSVQPSPLLNTGTDINWWEISIIIYLLVCVLLLADTLFGLLKIRSIARFYKSEKMGNIWFVETDAPGTPFSFFNWLFWDEKIPLDSAKGKQIFNHELFHIRQKHSWDIMFMSFLSIICWINPFIYLIKKELRVIHEFLADEYASKEEGQRAYAELLVMHVLKTRQPFVNPFFQTQIKRRIAMITKTKTNGRRYARKLLALPFAALLLGLVAFRIHPAVYSAKEEITVIIDAGHGGFDPGAKSPDQKHDEASLTLELANTVKTLAPEYGVKVVMTRESGEAVGLTKQQDLQNRLAKSKASNAVAFLSLHVNSSGKPGEFQEKNSGFEAVIAGKRDDPKGRLLASAMLEKLAPVYSTRMQIKQRKDEGVFVLDKNICPSVLLQCGFINNQKDLEFFTDKNNQEKIARILLTVLREQGGKGSGVVQ